MAHQNFLGKIHKVTRLLSALSEHRWASDGYADIKTGHLQVLLNLTRENSTNNQLAAMAGITKQSMNRLVNELFLTGYISSSNTKLKDGRIKMIQLTEKGRSFITYLDTTRSDLEVKLSLILGKQQFKELNEQLQILTAFIETRHKEVFQK